MNHISPSQLQKFFMCQHAWYLEYVDGMRNYMRFPAHVGIALHEGAAFNYEQKIESHEDAKESDVVDFSRERFRANIINEGVEPTHEESTVGMKKVTGQYTDNLVKAAQSYAVEIAPRVQPVEVEQTMEIPLDEITLTGRVDCIDTENRVRDLKYTGSSSRWSQDAVDGSLSLDFYAALYRYNKGAFPSSMVIDVDIVLKTKTVCKEFESKRDDRHIKRLLNSANTMLAGVKAGVFQRAHPGHWKCSEKYCGYWAFCQYTI